MSVKLGINGFGPCGQAVFFAAFATQLRAMDTTASAPHVVSVVAINEPHMSTTCIAHLIAHEAAQHGMPGLTVEVATGAGESGSSSNGDGSGGVSDAHAHAGMGDYLLLGRGRMAVAVAHAYDYRAVAWGRWPHCIVVECSGVCTTRERCLAAHCSGARGAAGVVIAAQSADAALVVPAVNEDVVRLQQQQQQASGAAALPVVVCAGDAVEAALAPLLHALTRAMDIREVHYTAICAAQPSDGAGATMGGDGHGDARACHRPPHVASGGCGGACYAIVPCSRLPASPDGDDDDDNNNNGGGAAALTSAMQNGSVTLLRQLRTLEQAVPTLRGRVTGACYRVPVHRGCALDVVLHTGTAVTRTQLHEAMVAAATSAATANGGGSDGSGSGSGSSSAWLAVRRAAVTHASRTGDKRRDDYDGTHYISSDCLGDAHVLCELASTQVAANNHTHRLLLWVDLERNYAARLLAVAALLAARVAVR